MKKLLILLFSILISYNSYGSYHSYSETICVDTDAQETGGIIYLPSKTKPFTGKNLCKYENGLKKSEGNFKDGKKDGKRTSWNENGQIEAEVNYKEEDSIEYKDDQNKSEGYSIVKGNKESVVDQEVFFGRPTKKILTNLSVQPNSFNGNRLVLNTFCNKVLI